MNLRINKQTCFFFGDFAFRDKQFLEKLAILCKKSRILENSSTYFFIHNGHQFAEMNSTSSQFPRNYRCRHIQLTLMLHTSKPPTA